MRADHDLGDHAGDKSQTLRFLRLVGSVAVLYYSLLIHIAFAVVLAGLGFALTFLCAGEDVRVVDLVLQITLIRSEVAETDNVVLIGVYCCSSMQLSQLLLVVNELGEFRVGSGDLFGSVG